ncbi:MAG: hypothetical protein GY909_00360 [Oligoflexia bacterium]|nr:hypothetical protein [Oligoflexia bacterium]
MKNFNLLVAIGLISISGCNKETEVVQVPTTTSERLDQNNSRSEASRESRTKNLERMNEANTFAQKLTYAQAYTDAFDHQLLVNKKNAVTEYFRNVGENLKAFKDLDDVKATSEKTEALNLFALAVSLKGNKSSSMLSLIHDALKKAEPLAKGLIGLADLTDYEEEVLIYQEEAKLMLNLRYNINAAMALVSLSDEKKLRHLSSIFKGKKGSLNTVQQQRVNSYLLDSISARDFMRSAGIQAKLDKSIRKPLSKIKVDETFKQNMQTLLFN